MDNFRVLFPPAPRSSAYLYMNLNTSTSRRQSTHLETGPVNAFNPVHQPTNQTERIRM